MKTWNNYCVCVCMHTRAHTRVCLVPGKLGRGHWMTDWWGHVANGIGWGILIRHLSLNPNGLGFTTPHLLISSSLLLYTRKGMYPLMTIKLWNSWILWNFLVQNIEDELKKKIAHVHLVTQKIPKEKSSSWVRFFARPPVVVVSHAYWPRFPGKHPPPCPFRSPIHCQWGGF